MRLPRKLAMRILLLIFTEVLFVITPSWASNKAVIVVFAEGSSDTVITLTQYRPMFKSDTVAIAVSKLGVFVLEVEPNSGDYWLRLGTDRSIGRLFLAPHDSIVVRMQPGKPVEIGFDRFGANRLFQDSLTSWLHDDDPYYHHMGHDEWPSFQQYLQSVRTHLNSVAQRVGIEYPEHRHMATWLRYHGAEKYWYGTFNYIGMHYWDTADKDLVRDLQSLNILDSVPWTSPEICQNSEIWGIIGSWLNAAVTRSTHAGNLKYDAKEYVERVFEIVNRLPECIRPYVLSSAMAYADRADVSVSYPIVAQYCQRFFATTTDTSFNFALRTKLERLGAKLPGKLAPAFVLPDDAGNMVSLSQFHGKLIYLDFWGSWCMPCLHELPFLDTLEQKFKNDTNIVFVSIGLEGEGQIHEWKKTIEYRQLRGVQLLAKDQFRNEAAKAYGIESVPTFMLIGPDGSFINAAAPRPSDPAAEQAIRDALKGLTNP